MTLKELIDVWEELHIDELRFCDFANAVEKVVGITDSDGVKVRILDFDKPLLHPREWMLVRVMELKNQQPHP